MTQTPNYDLNMFDSNDDMEENSRLGLNDNADKIDTALKGIQDDIDGLDASEVSYDNTVSGLTAETVQGAIDEISQPATTTTAGLMSASDKEKLDGIDAIDISNEFTVASGLGLQGRISAFYQPATRKVHGTISLYTVTTTIGTVTPYATVSQAYRPSVDTRYAVLVKGNDNTMTPYDIKIATNGEITQMLTSTSKAIYAGYFEYYI